MKYTLMTWALLTILLSGCEKEALITPGELPDKINSYISTHFPNNPIIQSTEEVEGFTKTFDIVLEGNIKLEFNRKKEIVEIDGQAKLPDSVIPEKIRTYVATNYPENIITDWELEDRNQQIELDNDLELEFDKSGNFLRIDS